MIKPVGNYSFATRVIKSKPVQGLIRYADKNPALFQSMTVFVSASILRPMTLLSSPAKTESRRQDNLYSSSRSIASGITDLVFSSALFLPANKLINKISETAFKNSKSIIYNNEKACKMYKNVLNRSLKLLVVPVIAYLNFKYLTNIAKCINKVLNRGDRNANK